MSGASIGGLVGGIAGAAIGSLFGMTALGWMIGSTLGGIAGNAMDPTVIQQPGLNDKKLQSSSYGVMLPYVWGKFRLAGTLDWIGNNGEMTEHTSSSGGKGGGPSVEKKSYTAKWSVKYCKSTRKGQPAIVGILKHWATGRVVVESDINPTVYIGNKEQQPDSTMEADLGVGEVSADRFIAKEVYNEVQMEQFFNALPQMEVLVTTKGEQNGAITQVAYETRDAWWPGDGVISWTTNWQEDATFPDPAASATYEWLYIESGYAHRVTEVGTYVYADGATVKLWHDWTTTDGMLPVGGAGIIKGLGAGATPNGAADFLAAAGVETGRYCHGCTLSADGRTLVAITSESAVDLAECDQWHRIVNGVMTDEGTIDLDGAGELLTVQSFGVSNRAGANSGVVGYGNQVANQLENNGTWIWQANSQSYPPIAPPGPSFPPNPLLVRLLYIDDSDGVLKQYLFDPEWQSYGGPQVANLSLSIFVTEEGYVGVIGGQSAFTPGDPNQTVKALYTRSAGTAALTLAEILADVFELKPSSVGDLYLTPSRYDVSAAESVLVHGVLFGSQMQKRNFIAILMQAFNFDIVESDDGTDAFLKVVFRGGSPVDTIPDDDLGVHDEGDGPAPLLDLIAHMQDWELPARVNVAHYDPEQEYQIGSQFAQRAWPFVDNVTQIQLPIVMSKDKARNIAKRELYRIHLERDTYGFSTSRKWAHLEPTDVVTVQGRDIRITKKTETPTGVVRFEGVLSAPYIDEQIDDGAPSEGTTPNPPAGERVATKLLLLDVPLRNDSQADYTILAAMGPAIPDGSWKGASLQWSVDGGNTYSEIVSTNLAARIGTATTALPEWTGGYQIDYTSRVTVQLDSGELESFNEEALYNGANLCLIGDEFVQFGTAELVSEGVYTLSTLLRGRRGTEQAMGHAIGDRFVMLADCVEVPLTASALNAEVWFKAVSFGKTETSATGVAFTNSGKTLRCYAPCAVTGGANVDGDLQIDWIRRTRRGGEWQPFTEVQLGEETEKYVLEIWNSTYTECARVDATLTTDTFIYTAAMQVADWGAEQEWIYGRVAQIGENGAGMFQRFLLRGTGSVVDIGPLVPVDPYIWWPAYVPPPTPGGPSPSPTAVITADNNNYRTSGFTIGQRLLFKFTTRATPAITTARIGIGEYQDGPWYRACKVSTDASGLMTIAETGGLTPSIYLGSLSPSTDYYITLETSSAWGNPSGPIGTGCDVIIYIDGVF